MSNESTQRQTAEALEENIQSIYDRYAEAFAVDKKLLACAKKLLNRSKEYNSPAFLILVVGPVKSGKSTLVNLFADFKVSPTDFLECTVRPSLISSTTGDQKMDVYRSNEDMGEGNNVKDEQIELIFDHINGLIGEGEIPDVDKASCDLTEENLKRYVKANLVKGAHDPILLTSIKTKGGILLKDNVYIIDMPGFDGARSNLDNAGYRKIAERADLIIFVQSSNSAISKISTDFFKLISENNSKVPVCLVQNVFKSAYWRDPEKLKAEIEQQRQHAINTISAASLSIDDSKAFNLNLGQVTDFRSKEDNAYLPQYYDELRESSEYFDVVQQQMYDIIIKGRGAIRINNCINRTMTVKRDLTDIIDSTIEQRQLQLAKYTDIETSFNDLCDRPIDFAINWEDIRLRAYNGLLNELTQFYEVYRSQTLPEAFEVKTKFKTVDAREKVRMFLQEATQRCISYYDNEVRSIMRNIAGSSAIMNWIVDSDVLLSRQGLTKLDNTVLQHQAVVPLELDTPQFDYEAYIHHKLFTAKHNQKEMDGYLAHAAKLLFQQYDLDTFRSDFLTNEVIPRFERAAKESVQNMTDYIRGQVIETLTAGKDKLLTELIPDIETFTRDTEMLKKANAELKKIHVAVQ